MFKLSSFWQQLVSLSAFFLVAFILIISSIDYDIISCLQNLTLQSDIFKFIKHIVIHSIFQQLEVL